MSLFTSLYGSGAGAPIGSIVAGNVSPGGDWLPLDGTVYNKADYPELDTSCMLTVGNNTLVTRQTLVSGGYFFAATASVAVWYPASAPNPTYYSSSDNGVTWISRTFPGGNFGGIWNIAVANGVFFAISNSSIATIYTSTDGVSWTARSLPGARPLSAVGYVGGLYVLVQYSLSASNVAYVLRSADLATWTMVTLPAYAPGAEASTFYPKNNSLITHPVHGLLFSFYVSNYSYAYRTRDGINYTIEQIMRTDGAERIITTISASAQYDDNYRVILSAGPGSASGHIGNTPGNLRPTGRGQYFNHITKNLGVLTAVGHSQGASLSETGGASAKVPLPFNYSYHGKQGDRIFFHSASDGVVRSIDIDTTKFVATKGIVDYDEPAENLYIKAR